MDAREAEEKHMMNAEAGVPESSVTESRENAPLSSPPESETEPTRGESAENEASMDPENSHSDDPEKTAPPTSDITLSEAEPKRKDGGLVSRIRRRWRRSPSSDASPPPRPPTFATVCVNNVNRSMEAHVLLESAGLHACSFGGGSRVCFPGRTADTPRYFSFSTTYERMLDVLKAEDAERYARIGVLEMLERNVRTKPRPQRWQNLTNKQILDIDVVVCLDYQMFITILHDMRMRIRLTLQKQRLHVICLEVEDTPEDAHKGGALALALCKQLQALKELSDERVKEVVVRFEQEHQLQMFYVGLRI